MIGPPGRILFSNFFLACLAVVLGLGIVNCCFPSEHTTLIDCCLLLGYASPLEPQKAGSETSVDSGNETHWNTSDSFNTILLEVQNFTVVVKSRRQRGRFNKTLSLWNKSYSKNPGSLLWSSNKPPVCFFRRLELWWRPGCSSNILVLLLCLKEVAGTAASLFPSVKTCNCFPSGADLLRENISKWLTGRNELGCPKRQIRLFPWLWRDIAVLKCR